MNKTTMGYGTMKKPLLFILYAYFACTFLSLPLRSQEQNQANQVAANDAKYDYYPLAFYDPRIRLKKVSFVRRHADNGKGEFLDVQIELESRVMSSHNYSIYVIAAHERDAQNDEERALVPYPSWRPYNPLAEKKILTFVNIMPVNIPVVEIWGEEEYKRKQEEVDKMISRGFTAEMPEPSFDEFMLYLTKNPQKALPFTLYGEEGPIREKMLVHNYVPQTEEERKNWKHETLKDHTYTMYSTKYKTTIISHHYTQYRPNFYTFNKVGILVFDPTKEKNNLILRRIIDIGKLKMAY